MDTRSNTARREDLAAALRAALAMRNINTADLARLMVGRLSKSTVYRYWNGSRDITLDDLEAICEATGVDLWTLLRFALKRD